MAVLDDVPDVVESLAAHIVCRLQLGGYGPRRGVLDKDLRHLGLGRVPLVRPLAFIPAGHARLVLLVARLGQPLLDCPRHRPNRAQNPSSLLFAPVHIKTCISNCCRCPKSCLD
ncbi:uncharacterized protein J3R85_000591 [Psidium guajava]|nr:uncharacterized protein J3R85_000591 [Psidium guajava]